MEEFLIVGTISSPHGVHGEVKVYPLTDDVLRFKKLKEIYLDTGKEQKLLHITGVKFSGTFVVLKFEEFTNRNDVENLRHKNLLVDRKHAVKCKKDEYFITDLIGVSVSRDDDSYLGELTDVIQTGANDVYVVKKEDGKEVLLPAIKECILNVDIENRTMKVFVMPGLED